MDDTRRDPKDAHRATRTRLALAGAIACIAAAAAFAPTYAAPSTPRLIHVDDDAQAGGDGSGKRPFVNLTEAIAAARTRPNPVVILVQPGDYPQATSLTIDIPLELRGSTTQVTSLDDPWPSGDVDPDTETRVYATSALGSQPLVRVGRVDGVVIRDVSISGFAFEATTSNRSVEVLLTRVQGFRVFDNVFRAPGFFAFQSVASSGNFTGNHMSGVATGAIFNGGYPESPSSIVATGNRAVSNSLGGILLNGASINIPELGDQLQAIVRGNDLSGNVGNQGFGLRIFIQRRDAGAPGDTQSSAHVQARVQDNRIVGNRFGVVVDAGFPYRSVAGVCDPRVFSGSIMLELLGNTVSGNQDRSGLITFTRSTAALTQSTLSQWQYLHGSTFTVSDPDGTLGVAAIDHPAVDPFLGPCPGDATQEPLENVLIYNGVVQPNGRSF